MKSYKRVMIAFVLFVLIIGGLEVLKHSERAKSAGVNAVNKVQERIDMARAKQDEIVQQLRARFFLNSQNEEAAEESTEGEIRYSTDDGSGILDDFNSILSPYRYDMGYIFMGDSRIYLMNIDCAIDQTENFFVVTCPGVGYDWMMSSGLPQVENIRASHPEIRDWVLISGFGLNDIGRANDYIRTYQELAKTIDLRLLSVNPTMGTADPRYSNNNIEAFNENIKKVVGTQYINCYDYLKNKGFWMLDELHYNEQSNWDIYAFILDSLYVDSGMVTGSDSKDRAQKLRDRLSVAS